jgi:hypothetical protein
MAFGDGSKSRFAYIAESAFGTTPSTPTFKEIRRTGGSIEPQKQTVRSGQISYIRDIRAELLVGQSVGGNIPFEFNNANFDDFLEAVLGGTWATNVLKTGNTQRWFTFEETIPVGATSNYHRFLGCAINSLSLDIPMRGLITSSIDLMGKQASAAATSIISGATYTAPNAETPFTSDKITAITILGTTPVASRVTLNITNNMRERPSVGSLYTDEHGLGGLDVSGSVEAYYSDNTFLDAIRQHSSGVITFTMGVDANKKYTFNLPAAQIGNGSLPSFGKNDDVMVRFDFTGLYDSSESTSLKVTRLVA